MEINEMTINEKKMNLFDAPIEYYLVHCISGDYELGKGIAKQFNEKYNMRLSLYQEYPKRDGFIYDNVGKALLVDDVFNLVTKPRYFNKPTYGELRNAIHDMKVQCLSKNIKYLAMPRIGAGLDRLEWRKVKDIIIDEFRDTNIDILVCYL